MLHRSGTDTLRQLYYALIDLKIHSSYNPQPGVFLHETDLYKDVIAKTTVMAPLLEDRYACCAFSALHALLPITDLLHFLDKFTLALTISLKNSNSPLINLPFLPALCRFLCTFTHIFSGGYASGYYGYKW